MKNFMEMLQSRWREGKFLCVGLDTDFKKLPKPFSDMLNSADGIWQGIYEFNRAIIDATKDLVCAYKPNIAFYEKVGPRGFNALLQTISYIHGHTDGVPVILDAKRGDIDSTNAGYVESIFSNLDADAVTIHPYLGREAMMPFLQKEDKGIFILCRTSNKGAGELQDLPVNGKPLYQQVARNVAEKWNGNGNCGVVVGATYPEELALVRQIIGDMPILIPGIGAQGGDVMAAVEAGINSQGNGIIINASRSIIFASSGADFAEAARREAEKLHKQITDSVKAIEADIDQKLANRLSKAAKKEQEK